MPVDNRNFIIEDLPDDPEDILGPEDEDDDEIEEQQPPRQTFRAPWQTSTPPSPPPPTTIFPPRPVSPWINTFNSYQRPPQPTQPQGYQQSTQNKIPRRKKIIFCDLLDILIESESAVREVGQSGYMTPSNNYKRTGIMPRGLYDIRLKTEVWGKLAAFGADYIFCITNQAEKSKEDTQTWKVMTDYVMYALADYLNLPHSHCRCLTKLGFDRSSEDVKPGTGLLKKALATIPGYKYKREDLVVVGINSGYQNQADIDRRMAKNARIDYIDVQDLLTIYY